MSDARGHDDSADGQRPQNSLARWPQYEDKYRLCYLRCPEGILVALAEELWSPSSL